MLLTSFIGSLNKISRPKNEIYQENSFQFEVVCLLLFEMDCDEVKKKMGTKLERKTNKLFCQTHLNGQANIQTAKETLCFFKTWHILTSYTVVISNKTSIIPKEQIALSWYARYVDKDKNLRWIIFSDRTLSVIDVLLFMK